LRFVVADERCGLMLCPLDGWALAGAYRGFAGTAGYRRAEPYAGDHVFEIAEPVEWAKGKASSAEGSMLASAATATGGTAS